MGSIPGKIQEAEKSYATAFFRSTDAREQDAGKRFAQKDRKLTSYLTFSGNSF
jgi:hypothetical protein